MNSILNLVTTVMPILVAIFILVIIVTFIVVNGKTKQTIAISKKSFEELAHELKAEHAILQSELADIKESLNSINKMMKEIE